MDLGEKSEPRFAVGLRHFAGTQRKGWSVFGQGVASSSKDDKCFRHIVEPGIVYQASQTSVLWIRS